ncbi:MAG: 3-deoxy-manno-octulosonate cytidylyltransferase [Deltaproteobacteria bacterium]|nr:3-deoxy-manno-octulosonate cytidylyltransferase [Deltaproteobacteria bacterium]
MCKVVAIIPARFGSTRLPGKPLIKIKRKGQEKPQEKPMIEWVYEAAKKVKNIIDVYVATEDERVSDAVKHFGGKAILTPNTLKSGTDRVAFVAKDISADIYINIQGDEPFLEPFVIESALNLVLTKKFTIGTAATFFKDINEVQNLNTVKVLVDSNMRAIYFSRFPIPYSRDGIPLALTSVICKKHIGVYVYTRDALLHFAGLRQTELEKAEALEQLRAMEHGIPIGVSIVDCDSIGIDTLEDLEKIKFYG